MYLGREMFEAVADRDLARRLFAASVARVEIETHSYCNRRCSYCPNVIGDRIGENVRIAEGTWRMALENLAEIAYARILVLNNYNEPLADRTILDRIREARAALPGARIVIHTNGDYLDPGYVEALAEAGLSRMHVSIHLKQGDGYDDLYVINRIVEVAVRMGIASKVTAIRPGEYAVARVPHRRMQIEIRGINFARHGTNRGGLIAGIEPPAPRTAPCFFPFAHFYIGFSGNVVPCCHLRSDRPEHAPYVIGNMAEYASIFQAFSSEAAAAWRRALVGRQRKRAPCDTCSAAPPRDPRLVAAFERAERALGTT